MARLVTIGFEMNDTTYEFTTYAGTPSIEGSPVRTGSYALKLDSGETVGWTLGTPTRIYLGVGFYVDSIAKATDLIECWTSGDDLFTIEMGIGGVLEMVRGTTTVATSERNVDAGGYYYMEVDYYPDNASGVCTIRINGAEWLTFTGDTKDTDDTFIGVRLKCTDGNIVHYDDLVINDNSGSVNNTWPGQQKLYLAVPNAAGDATELTASAGDNYAAVDELPPNTADYVYGSTATNRDLYNISDPLAGTETLGNVVVNYVAKLDSGSGNIAATLKAGTTEDDGDTEGLTESWLLYQYAWAVNPDDSAAWEPTDIDGLQIGVEIKA